MIGEPSKWTEFLEKLLPFLVASPLWLKYWIYAIIFLNLLTIAGLAVSYLVSRERVEKGKTREYGFSIESPRPNEEIPLGTHQSIVLEGQFPRLTDNQDLAGTGKIVVEVTKMPNKHIPQTGKERISTAGHWRFESAKFSGEGPYEIVVTAYLGKEEVFRTIDVNCREKAEVYKRRIEKEREIRGATRLELTQPEAIALQDVKGKLRQMQYKFFDLFDMGDWDGALENVTSTLDILDPVLTVFPDDLELQSDRAYSFKNYAQVMIRLKRDTEVERALAEAEVMFEAIRDQEPHNAGAWNGLGSVFAVRGYYLEKKRDCQNALENYRTALRYIDITLDIMKDNYPAAQLDRETVMKGIKRMEACQENE